MNSDSVSLSVVIPTYNYGCFISDAIDSCLRQEYKNKEIIIVNDGSEDCTDEIIKKYTNKIIYVKQENSGVAYARNKGASISKGEWLLFLDADDVLCENAVEKIMLSAKNSDAGVVFGKTLQFNDKNQIIERYNTSIEGQSPIPAKKNFLKSLIVTPGAAVVKKSIFKKVHGFKDGLHHSEDRHFWLKCGAITSFKFCDENIVFKKKHKMSASEDGDKIIYNGMLVQIDFLSWCYENKIDTFFIEYKKEDIIILNTKKAFLEKKWQALHAILLHAKLCNINIKNINVFLYLFPIIRLMPYFISSKIVKKIAKR